MVKDDEQGILQALDARVPGPRAGLPEDIFLPLSRERGHYVALAYRCRLTGPPAEAVRFTGGVPGRGQRAWHEHCPPNLLAIQAGYRRFF